MEDLKLSRRFENAIKAARPEGGSPLSSVVPEPFDISANDISYLMNLAASGDLFMTVHLAFIYGFVMGNRATYTQKMKRL